MGKNATGIKATGQDLLGHLIADFLGKGGSSSEFRTVACCMARTKILNQQITLVSSLKPCPVLLLSGYLF